MLAAGRFAIVLIVSLSILSTACQDDPPEKEIQQAQSAIDTAQSVGAEQYARDEYVAGQQALKQAREAVTQRDYRLALNHALDAREHAQTAGKQVAEIKAKERADAERAITEADAALATARTRLKAGTAARVPTKLTSAEQHAIAAVESSVQEARAALARGEIMGIAARVGDATANLRSATRDLDAALGPAPRRRRS
jgi:copper oxidase (laccase) domain-containing protein